MKKTIGIGVAVLLAVVVLGGLVCSSCTTAGVSPAQLTRVNTDLSARIDALTADASTLRNRITSLEGRPSGASQSDLDVLSTTITGLQTTITALQVRITSLEGRIAALEVGEQASLRLTIVGALPTIVNENLGYPITVQVQNLSTSPKTGRLVLQLTASTGSCNVVGNITVVGSPFPSPLPVYEPTKAACTRVTMFSEFITLAGNQGATYQFTVTVEDQTPDVFWWIPTVQVVE